VGRWPVDAGKIGLFTQALAGVDRGCGAICRLIRMIGILELSAMDEPRHLSSMPLCGVRSADDF